MGGAIGRDGAHIGGPADRHQRREATGRKSEHADARGIDRVVLTPRRQHIVDQYLDMTRAIFGASDQGSLPIIVARMGDGSDHEACFDERERSVVMACE